MLSRKPVPYRFTNQGYMQVGFWFPVIDLRSYAERVKDQAAAKKLVQAARAPIGLSLR